MKPLRFATVLAAAALAAGLVSIPTSSAQAAGPSLTATVQANACPGNAFACRATFITAPMAAGTPVTMSCWKDAVWTDGKTYRWFYVTASGYREGYVRAAYVRNQVATPNCTTTARRAIWAAAWGTARYGQAGWDGDCLRFTREAWLATGRDIGRSYSAATYWNASPYPRHTSSDPRWKVPPRGALVFWGARTGYPYGHVAISLGNGWLVTTLERTTSKVHFTTIKSRNQQAALNATYKGWVMPPA